MTTAPERHHDQLAAALGRAPVVPVIVIDDLATAVPLARALVSGGLSLLEITLRTPVALEALRRIAGEVEGALCGVGTVLTPEQLTAAEKAGARFAVSPGSTARLLDAAEASPVPLLPGANTPSETMALRERGYRLQKFFPAEQSGGAAYLSSLSTVIADVRFCPTGGITVEKAPTYLALKNVICVGGSWIMPKAAVAAGEFAAIEALARAAAALRG
jgi:2-dehydro-3-deoxyphosphogluconate aldolase/(4S)-4-hydroxy-2-oxoglutarate aldolase